MAEKIISHPPTPAYKRGWEQIFGEKERKNKIKVKEKATKVDKKKK